MCVQSAWDITCFRLNHVSFDLIACLSVFGSTGDDKPLHIGMLALLEHAIPCVIPMYHLVYFQKLKHNSYIYIFFISQIKPVWYALGRVYSNAVFTSIFQKLKFYEKLTFSLRVNKNIEGKCSGCKYHDLFLPVCVHHYMMKQGSFDTIMIYK